MGRFGGTPIYLTGPKAGLAANEKKKPKGVTGSGGPRRAAPKRRYTKRAKKAARKTGRKAGKK